MQAVVFAFSGHPGRAAVMDALTARRFQIRQVKTADEVLLAVESRTAQLVVLICNDVVTGVALGLTSELQRADPGCPVVLLAENSTETPAIAPSRSRVSRPLVGSGFAIQRTRSEIDKAAANDLNVLITGETGTGTELVAQGVHQQSRRNGTQ